MQVVRGDAEGHGELDIMQRALKLLEHRRTPGLVRRLSRTGTMAKVGSTVVELSRAGLGLEHRR